MIQRECFLYLKNPKDNFLLSHELVEDLVCEAAFVCAFIKYENNVALITILTKLLIKIHSVSTI